MEFQFPAELVVPISALSEERTIDLSQLDAETVVDLARHGLKQLLNDATSGLKDDLPKARERVDGVWKKVQEGEWSYGAGGGRRMDPVESMIRRMAFTKWRHLGVKGKVAQGLFKDHEAELVYMAAVVGKQLPEKRPDSKEWLQRCLDLGAKNLSDANQAKIHDTAREAIAAEKADLGVKIDLGEEVQTED